MSNPVPSRKPAVVRLASMALLLCSFGPRMAAANAKNWLISPAEAKSLSEGSVQMMTPDRDRRTSNAVTLDVRTDDGPQLQVDQPLTNLVHSPINMRIRFIARNSPVDVSSLEVHAQKWVLGAFRGNLDLSPRVRQFVVQDGIDMKQQDLPKGRYRLTLDIHDAKGAKTEAVLSLDVE